MNGQSETTFFVQLWLNYSAIQTWFSKIFQYYSSTAATATTTKGKWCPRKNCRLVL